MGLDDFIDNACHAMFGFEKPAWFCLPRLGALMTALESIPEARRRFNDGELLPGARLMVRHRTSGEDEFAGRRFSPGPRKMPPWSSTPAGTQPSGRAGSRKDAAG
jgi:hypothetical protein